LRRRRRDRSRPALSEEGQGAGEEADPGRRAPREEDFEENEQEPSVARKLLPQLVLSAVALAVAALALVVMWKVAQGG
ncbi:MAG: hypothetical protein ACOC0J_00870, partial [Myxococcota bacterium]